MPSAAILGPRAGNAIFGLLRRFPIEWSKSHRCTDFFFVLRAVVVVERSVIAVGMERSVIAFVTERSMIAVVFERSMIAVVDVLVVLFCLWFASHLWVDRQKVC